MSAKADDAALLAQGKEENVGRRKIDRKDGLVFKLSDYIACAKELHRMAVKINGLADCAVSYYSGFQSGIQIQHFWKNAFMLCRAKLRNCGNVLRKQNNSRKAEGVLQSGCEEKNKETHHETRQSIARSNSQPHERGGKNRPVVHRHL